MFLFRFEGLITSLVGKGLLLRFSFVFLSDPLILKKITSEDILNISDPNHRQHSKKKA